MSRRTDHAAGSRGGRPGARIRGAEPLVPHRSPILLAAAATVMLFGFSLVVLRPGYWINDDLKIIWNLSGYPGNAAPSPFPIYNNVILGLILTPLYALRTSANWYIVLLIVIDALSVWGLLSVIMAAPGKQVPRPLIVLGAAASLSGLTLDLTYTITAFLASISGLALLHASLERGDSWRGGLSLWGIGLVTVGSLIRLPMVAMGLAIGLPLILARPLRVLSRQAWLSFAILSALVIGAAAFDRVYVRSSPEWSRFYTYNEARRQLHDSHRLNNLHGQIRRIGWSPNDQELFAHWFYPDEHLYSLENLKYLIRSTSSTTQDPLGTLGGFAQNLGEPRFYPYVLLLLALTLWAVRRTSPAATRWSILATLLVALALNLGLAVFYKDPPYVLACTLAGSTLIGMIILSSESANGQPLPSDNIGAVGDGQIRSQVAMAMTVLAIAVLAGGYLQTSQTNTARQRVYEQVQADLKGLQATGALSKDALIVSPAHGLPYEWSDPLHVDLPSPSFLDTGWITFSPSYERVLASFGIRSLPDAILGRDNIYLFVESSFGVFLRQYYLEHAGLKVRMEPIYTLPNPLHWAGYDGIVIIKVLPDG